MISVLLVYWRYIISIKLVCYLYMHSILSIYYEWLLYIHSIFNVPQRSSVGPPRIDIPTKVRIRFSYCIPYSCLSARRGSGQAGDALFTMSARKHLARELAPQSPASPAKKTKHSNVNGMVRSVRRACSLCSRAPLVPFQPQQAVVGVLRWKMADIIHETRLLRARIT